MNALEPDAEAESPFPKTFHWGTATSSHQVEGDNHNNDWWDWEQDPAHVFDHTRSGRALEWWSGRAEEDLRRARELGQNAHRLSLEWSRIEPEPGRLDDAAFARYAEILRGARACGLTLNVTLNHFTLPRWLAARGGWLADDTPERFASAQAYARICATRGAEIGI
jgi:beta-glucosidase